MVIVAMFLLCVSGVSAQTYQTSGTTPTGSYAAALSVDGQGNYGLTYAVVYEGTLDTAMTGTSAGGVTSGQVTEATGQAAFVGSSAVGSGGHKAGTGALTYNGTINTTQTATASGTAMATQNAHTDGSESKVGSLGIPADGAKGYIYSDVTNGTIWSIENSNAYGGVRMVQNMTNTDGDESISLVHVRDTAGNTAESGAEYESPGSGALFVLNQTGIGDAGAFAGKDDSFVLGLDGTAEAWVYSEAFDGFDAGSDAFAENGYIIGAEQHVSSSGSSESEQDVLQIAGDFAFLQSWAEFFPTPNAVIPSKVAETTFHVYNGSINEASQQSEGGPGGFGVMMDVLYAAGDLVESETFFQDGDIPTGNFSVAGGGVTNGSIFQMEQWVDAFSPEQAGQYVGFAEGDSFSFTAGSGNLSQFAVGQVRGNQSGFVHELYQFAESNATYAYASQQGYVNSTGMVNATTRVQNTLGSTARAVSYVNPADNLTFDQQAFTGPLGYNVTATINDEFWTTNGDAVMRVEASGLLTSEVTQNVWSSYTGMGNLTATAFGRDI